MRRAAQVSVSILSFMIVASFLLPSIGYSKLLLSPASPKLLAGTAQSNVGQYDEPCTVMHPDPATLREWIRQYNATPSANIDPSIAVPTSGTSFNLLGHLQYTPSERNQGYAGNCWVWAGTGVLEVALHVQTGIKDRLSIQYFDSNYNGGTTTIWGKWAGCGGSLTKFASFYNTQKIAIPWSNTNAYYQDSSRSCESGGTLVSASSISTSPNYPITTCTANAIPNTHNVARSTAISNIKNVLLQNNAVYFSFALADSSDWSNFNTFWKNQGEGIRWSPDFSNGHVYNYAPNEGGGHAVLCVGWDDTDPNNSYWIMVNSWGTASGLRPNGIFHLDMNMNYDCYYHDPADGRDYYSLYWQTLSVYFAQYDVHLESREDNGASSNKGMISSYFLPTDILKPPGSYSATYYPESGYSFVKWETSGGVSVLNSGSGSTTVTISASGTLRAIYKSSVQYYTVTYYTDPISGTITASGVLKTNGMTDTFPLGARVRVVANPPSGYVFSYWQTGGVSVDSTSSQDTYITVSNNGWLKAYFNIPTRTIRVYSLPISYLGQDPEYVASNNIGASIKVDYVYQGQSQTRTSNTIFDVTADVGSTITFSIASTTSGWTFANKWDHYGWLGGQIDAVILQIQVPSGSGIDKVAAFFARVYQVTFASSGIGGDTGTAVIVTVNGVGYQQSQLPYTGSYGSGTLISYAFVSTVSGGLGKQYVWMSTLGLGQTGRTGSFTVSAVGTVTANYKTQYYLTVTSAHDLPMPTSGWFDAGMSIPASVTTPAEQSGGTRHRCTGWTGTGSVPSSGSVSSVTFTIGAPSSITWNWMAQYYLAVNSAYGSPTGSGWYDSGSSAPFSVTSPVSGGAGIRYVCTGYSGDASGSGTSGSITMNSPKAVTFNWKTQYYLTVNTNPAEVLSLNPAAVSTQGWYDSGPTATVNAVQNVDKVAGSSRYDFRSWTGATPTGSGNQASVLMDGPKTATANYQLQYKITFTQSGVGSDFTGTIVIIDGTNYGLSVLPTSFWWDGTSTHSFAFSSPLVVTANAKKYLWTSATGLSTAQSGSIAVSGSGSVTGNYKTQYQLTMQVNPVGSGSTSPAVGTYWYDAGAPVNITAVPASGWVFWSWTAAGTGSYTGSSNPANIVMNGPISETVTFAALFTVGTTTTTSVTSTISTSSSISTYQRSNTTTTATIPSTSYQTATTTRYSGATSTTYTTRTTLYSTLTSLSTTTTTSTKMSTVVSTESTGTTTTTTTRTSMTTESTTEPFDRLQYQGAVTATQTFTSTFTSGGTIYLKVVIQYTSTEQYLQKIFSTIISWINQITQVFQNIFLTTIARDTTVRVEPAPRLGETIGTLFSSNSSLGFMNTGNIYDDSGIGFIYGHRNPPKILFTKADGSRVLPTGQPTWLDYARLVTVGGCNANPTTKYYEDQGLAPLRYAGTATNAIIVNGTGAVKLNISLSSINQGNDCFVLEVITDGTHKVVIVWGIAQWGTYAAGVYFDGVFTNMASLTDGWYIVRWQDLNSNGIPDYPAEFTIVASGI